MDTALTLRRAVESGKRLSGSQIDNLLAQSRIVKRLTKDFEEDVFFLIFRLHQPCFWWGYIIL